MHIKLLFSVTVKLLLHFLTQFVQNLLEIFHQKFVSQNKIKFQDHSSAYCIQQIKICQKYNVEYRSHYGRNQSYIKLKRKVEEHQFIMNKRNKKDNNNKCNYYSLDNDELCNSIRYYYIGY